MKVSAKPNPNRPGYRCTFRHPETLKVSSYGLNTRDKYEAEAVCLDIATIFNDNSHPPLRSDCTSPRLLAYKPRAVDIVFGPGSFKRLITGKEKAVHISGNVATLSGRIAALLGVHVDFKTLKKLDKILSEFESKRFELLKKKYEQLGDVNKVLKAQIEVFETERPRDYETAKQ